MEIINGERLVLGTCYYPEHWDENMIDEDLDNIIELGSNVIRIGEFAYIEINVSV